MVSNPCRRHSDLQVALPEFDARKVFRAPKRNWQGLKYQNARVLKKIAELFAYY